MKNFFLFLAVSFLLYLFWLGSSPRYSSAFRPQPEDTVFRDLYRLSYLPQFKEDREPCTLTFTKPDSVELWVIGDSFVEQMVDQNRLKVHFVHIDFQAELKLDTLKNHQLVVALVERNAFKFLNKPLRNFVPGEVTVAKKEKKSLMFFNEELFEENAFYHSWANRIKEWKALFNFHVLDKVSPKVVVKDNEIFYIEDEYSAMGEADLLKNGGMENYVNAMAQNKNYYLNAGFDKVSFAIIPNKMTAYGHTSDQWIKSLEKTANVDFISVVDSLKTSRKLYYRDDTHWSCPGRQIFLNAWQKQL